MASELPREVKMAKVAIVMGSESDRPVMKQAEDALRELGVEFETRVLSAHRKPEETARFARGAGAQGIRVLIAGAGGAAHLAGALAAQTTLPVIAVPIHATSLGGLDALLASVQMPKGVPVACVAVDGAWNAGVLAAQILAVGAEPGDAIRVALTSYKEKLAR